jgi:hypothetical protein
MKKSKRMRGIEMHMRSAVQEDFKFTVATIVNRQSGASLKSSLSEAAVAHGPQI